MEMIGRCGSLEPEVSEDGVSGRCACLWNIQCQDREWKWLTEEEEECGRARRCPSFRCQSRDHLFIECFRNRLDGSTHGGTMGGGCRSRAGHRSTGRSPQRAW